MSPPACCRCRRERGVLCPRPTEDADHAKHACSNALRSGCDRARGARLRDDDPELLLESDLPLRPDPFTERRSHDDRPLPGKHGRQGPLNKGALPARAARAGAVRALLRRAERGGRRNLGAGTARAAQQRRDGVPDRPGGGTCWAFCSCCWCGGWRSATSPATAPRRRSRLASARWCCCSTLLFFTRVHRIPGFWRLCADAAASAMGRRARCRWGWQGWRWATRSHRSTRSRSGGDRARLLSALASRRFTPARCSASAPGRTSSAGS